MDDVAHSANENGEAFVRLLMEYEPRVRGFLRALLPSWSDVDEVIQEASLVAWRKFSEFEEGTEFGGWFLTIARFEALKHRTKAAKSPLVFADQLWETIAREEANDSTEVLTRHLEQCMQKLEPSKRQILIKAHTSGSLIRDLAQNAGKSEQAMYKIIQRLRKSLLECVNKLRVAEKTL